MNIFIKHLVTNYYIFKIMDNLIQEYLIPNTSTFLIKSIIKKKENNPNHIRCLKQIIL
jgi:hypothetical protein